MARIKKILGSRLAEIICFLFAIGNRVVFTSLYSLIGADTKLQLAYAENLLAGKGMGITKYFANDLTTPVFDTKQFFPPGFSFTIIPFLKLTGGDEYKAVFIFDTLVAILFIIAIRFAGKKAGLPSWLNNIMILLAGTSQYLFFTSWSSTDAICVCLLLFALGEIVTMISKKQKIRPLPIVGCSMLFCLPFFFRYMYLPIPLLLPLLIVFSGIIVKNRSLKIGGLYILLTSACILGILFTYSLLTAGNVLYTMSFERGLFISQLELCYPFLPASFINVDFGAQLIATISGVDYAQVIVFFKIITLVLFITLLVLFCRYLFIQKRSILFSDHSLFITIGSVISFTIAFLLIYLTVTYKELNWGFYRWVHSVESRYFAFIYVFVPLVLFTALYHYSFSFKKLFVRFFVVLALCSLGIETIHGVYYNIKILSKHKSLEYIRDADKSFRNFPAIITQIKKQNPDSEIIICSPDKFYLYTSSQMGYKTIFDFENFLKTDLTVSEKTIFIMPIQTQDVSIIKDFITAKKPRLLTEMAGSSVYIFELNPTF